MSSRTHRTRAKNFPLRETPGKYRLLVLHSPGNREEFWYNSTFHKLENSTRGRGSDDSGAAARRSNKATLRYFIRYTFPWINDDKRTDR